MGKQRNRYVIADGWTFVEIAVVMVIIASLSTIAVPVYTSAKLDAQTTAAQQELKQIGDAIQAYVHKHGVLPKTLAKVGLDKQLDPWGRPYKYLRVQDGKGKGQLRKDHFLVPLNSDYDLYSLGPDGESAPPLTAEPSRDDIVRVNDGAYWGVARGY